MRTILLATLLPVVLLLPACTDDSAEPSTAESGQPTSEVPAGDATIDDITVQGSFGEAPTIEVPDGFAVGRTEVKVLSPGDGATLKAGDQANVHYAGVLGENGEQFDSSFDHGAPLTATLGPGGLIPGFVEGLEGQQVGSRVLVAIPPKDGYGAKGSGSVPGGATLVFVVDIQNLLADPADGAPQEVPASVPNLLEDKNGNPTKFAATPQTPDQIDEMSDVLVIRGDGPPVQLGQTLTVDFVAQIYPDGAVADSSWARKAPVTFPLNPASQVPSCWTDGLVGQPVGSRVYLLCPAESAYPAGGQQGSDSFIFAVDLLGAF